MIHDEEDETKDEIIEKKFFIAGYSARWFFSYTYQGTMEAVDRYISKTSDADMYTHFRIGHRDSKTRHHLLALFEGDVNVLVSPYTARLLLRRDEFKVIDTLLQFSEVQKNPAFHGWIVEFEFGAYLRAANKFDTCVRVRNKGEEGFENWKVKAVESFEPRTICSVPLNKWLTPLKWNQPAYDYVQFEEVQFEEETYNLVRFVQVTCADSHSFKLKYILQLLEKFNSILGKKVEFLDVVVVHPVSREPPKLNETGYRKIFRDYTDYKLRKPWEQKMIRFVTFDRNDLKNLRTKGKIENSTSSN